MSNFKNQDLETALIKKHPHFRNSRHVATALNDLIASIENDGILTPLIVWHHDEGTGAGEEYFLISGFRRLSAIHHIRLSNATAFEKIPCRIFTGDLKNASKINLLENVQREDLSPIEVAEHLAHLETLGYSRAEMGEIIGKSRSWAGQAVNFLKRACPELVQATRDNDIAYSLAMRISKVEPPAQQTKVVQEHLKLLENMTPRSAAAKTATGLSEDEEEEKEPKPPKPKLLRVHADILRKYNAYSTMDLATQSADVKAYVWGILTMGAWVLNHEVDFREVGPPEIDPDVTPISQDEESGSE